MIRLRRIRLPHRVRTAPGAEVVLVAEVWRFAVVTRRLIAGWSYARPLRIEQSEQRPIAIRDHVVITRLAAAAVIAGAWMATRRSDR